MRGDISAAPRAIALRPHVLLGPTGKGEHVTDLTVYPHELAAYAGMTALRDPLRYSDKHHAQPIGQWLSRLSKPFAEP